MPTRPSILQPLYPVQFYCSGEHFFVWLITYMLCISWIIIVILVIIITIVFVIQHHDFVTWNWVIEINIHGLIDCLIKLWICLNFSRNNGFAISTPSSEQYKGDGIAGRGPAGYGISAIRVDGTDVFAVYNATKAARDYALKNNKPVIVEAMAYRVGHHSTSDDSTAYRSAEEIEIWQNSEHPINKLQSYMKNKGWWNEQEENDHVKAIRKQVLTQISLSEKKPKADWREMFQNVYNDIPAHLKYVYFCLVIEFSLRFPKVTNYVLFSPEINSAKWKPISRNTARIIHSMISHRNDWLAASLADGKDCSKWNEHLRKWLFRL